MRQINNIFISYPFLEVNNDITITYVYVFQDKYLNIMNFQEIRFSPSVVYKLQTYKCTNIHTLIFIYKIA